jgi:hypothetical protein
MTQTVTGQVYRVFRKDWPPNARNPKGNTTYSIKLEGNDLYYRTTKAWAGIAEPGNIVSFEAKPKDDSSATIVGDVVKVNQQAAATVAGAVANAVGGDRQNHIVYQSSSKDALEYADLLIRNGAVKIPEKMAGKMKSIATLLDILTAQFYNDVSTLGAVTRVAAEDEAGEDETETDGAGEEE